MNTKELIIGGEDYIGGGSSNVEGTTIITMNRNIMEGPGVY